MISRVIGVCFIVFSSFWLLINTFVYLNTSAYLDYNAEEKLSLGEAKVLFPYFVFITVFVFGILLVKDRVYEEDHH